MVDQNELEICRRRAIRFSSLAEDKWSRCRWCGIWLRHVKKLEEREDDPPESERDRLAEKYK